MRQNEILKYAEHCRRFLPILEEIENDLDLKEWCMSYGSREDNVDLRRKITIMAENAYECGIVIYNYSEVLKDEIKGCRPTEEDIKNFKFKEVIASIAYQYRQDHFCNGSLIRESIGNGTLYRLYKEVYERYVNYADCHKLV